MHVLLISACSNIKSSLLIPMLDQQNMPRFLIAITGSVSEQAYNEQLLATVFIIVS